MQADPVMTTGTVERTNPSTLPGKKLSPKFCQMVQNLADAGSEGTFFSVLARKMNPNKKEFANLNLVHYMLPGGEILTLMNGSADWALEKYAEEFDFPRGFPLIWDSESMELLTGAGFWAKFKNQHEELSTDAIRINFFRKYSGFLSGVVLYRGRDGEIHWVSVSKKSANETVYVSTGGDLWGAILTKDRLEALWESGVGVMYGECMAFFDITHGGEVLRECIVPTCVAFRMGADTVRPRRLGTAEMVAFLRELGLDGAAPSAAVLMDTSVSIPAAKIEQFVGLLKQDRDFMTEEKFQDILKELGLPWESLHMSILGNTLEGLVLRMTMPDGRVITVKYKFAVYNVRTFLLRTLGRTYTPEQGTRPASDVFHRLGVDTPRGWRPTLDFAKALEQWVNHWVYSEPSRLTWRGIALAMAEEYDRQITVESRVAPWIRAADIVQLRVDAGETFDDLSQADVMALAEECLEEATVFVVVGPVGSGKTTVGEKVASIRGCQHVDGDSLLGVSAMMFGQERNTATVSAIARALAANGTVVVSTGGGALGAGFKKWDFTLPQQLQRMFPTLKIKVVICLPGDCWSVSSDQLGPKVVDTIYSSFDEQTKRTVVRRVECGEWTLPEGKTLPEFVKFITGLSRGNCRFAKAIGPDADAVVQFPCASAKTGKQPEITPEVYDYLVGCPRATPQAVATVGQLRMIYERDGKARHETCLFSSTGADVRLDLSAPSVEPVVATHVKISGENGCELFLLPERDGVTDQHLTMSAGSFGVDKAGKPIPRKPALMRKVARALVDGESQVDLGGGDTIDLADAVRTGKPVQQLGWVIAPPR